MSFFVGSANEIERCDWELNEFVECLQSFSQNVFNNKSWEVKMQIQAHMSTWQETYSC